MKTIHTSINTTLLILTTLALSATFSRADSYSQTNLRSDLPGVATYTDPNLVNPWGMAPNSSGTVIWVNDNGTGVSTLYNQDGTVVSSLPLVTIPTAARNKDGGNPTGIVRNGTAFFQVTKNGVSAPARFIFVSEDGSISGWNPALNPNDLAHAIAIAVDNGTNLGSERAIYKGATLGVANGHNFLYVTNFHTGRVETYDENFRKVNPRGFVDRTLPPGYAPFGIRNINGEIFVTYALQDAKAEDDVAGPGNGFVNVFDTSGNFVKRLISNGNLNAPWGLALAEPGELWVGNFGDGKINNYDPTNGAFLGTISHNGTPLQIDGLWDLLPLVTPSGPRVYFAAGIGDEEHGLFGFITED